ncbi:MAG: ATPase [Muribaculaceae bacterium]|nr:ATPase [Muribaculaceae bacterium]
MKLIADCGSTKIDWCLLDGKKIVKQVFTTGMNAIMLTEEEMAARIADELMPQIDAVKIDEIHYYGAGCLGDEVCGNVRRALAKNINAEVIEVDTDLLAAARALCGRKPGIACIMGTGSNSCYYDGEKIVDNVSPLGFILGDEGSGAVLGKLLVGDVLKNQIPQDLSEKFLKQYDLDRMKIIRRVYKEPQANRFLASLTPFLIENIEEPAIHRLVLNSFKSFFVRNISNYDQYRTMPINFVGSIAYYYRDVLTEAADSLDCTIGTIIKSPMEGLIQYHSAY